MIYPSLLLFTLQNLPFPSPLLHFLLLLLTRWNIQQPLQMIFSALFLGCYAGLALARNFTPAPVVTSNANTSYVAILDNSSSSSIRGSVTAKAGPDGIGLTFEVSFTGFPSGLGPFCMANLPNTVVKWYITIDCADAPSPSLSRSCAPCTSKRWLQCHIRTLWSL